MFGSGCVFVFSTCAVYDELCYVGAFLWRNASMLRFLLGADVWVCVVSSSVSGCLS